MTAKLTENGTEIFIDGELYSTVLHHVHRRAFPRTYLEIGTFSGDTLRLSQCRSVAVDPAFQLPHDLPIDRSRVTLREMTSDDYFASHSPAKDLGGKIDLGFLDGMHEFPFLLRDFINTERFCSEKSIIVMHDCIPLDYHMARPHQAVMAPNPSGHPGWTGDVWKMVPVLRQYRPDLDIHCLDAEPTGLTICRNLDPRSKVLKRAYEDIVRDWAEVQLKDYGMTRLFEAARIESAAAWRDTVEPFHLRRLRKLGATVQPRRRLKQAMAAVGLGSA